MAKKACDWVIVDKTTSSWPGALPYRTRGSRTGYKSESEARRRLRVVTAHYNATYGRPPGDLRVLRRCPE